MPLFPKNAQEIVDAFAAAITPRTKIISISHTVFITGLIMPLKELSRLAHEKGILILADSAHGIGMLDLSMKELGIDFFMSSPYKWLGAPTGIGLLYVRKEALDKVWPTIVSSGWDTTPSASKLDPGAAVRRVRPRPRRRPELPEPYREIPDRAAIKVLAGRLKQEVGKIRRSETPSPPTRTSARA